MLDSFGRNIDYMRISITDRCNLRCTYCMPHGIQLTDHSEILSYEEILRICSLAISLGIHKFKITGGEPLVRKGCVDFISRLKAMPGADQVTLTTNGTLLEDNIPALCAAGLDGVNISMDTLRPQRYRALTSYGGEIPDIERLVRLCIDNSLRTKINTVLLSELEDELTDVAALAERLPVDVRFIELMPIGLGRSIEGIPAQRVSDLLASRWPDLHHVSRKRGNGPAEYFHAKGLTGYIGFISAMSEKFCDGCNRIRLTGKGQLRCCLCYDYGVDLREPLRAGASDSELRAQMESCIQSKPKAHTFSHPEQMKETVTMNQIGG